MPSIVSAIVLAISRAIGETMIVVMSAGLIANFTFNPLNSVTTATVQIVTLLTGDQEFNSPKTLSAFAIAFSLFVITFCFNILAVYITKKLQKKYYN
jgi:phosphate transport system permease protein